MSDNLLMIVANEAQAAAEKGETLEEQIDLAMNAARNNWLVLDEDTQFRGAVAAIHTLADDSDKERIEAELKGLKILAAMASGVPVDIAAAFEGIGDVRPIGLSKRWKELAKSEAK